MTFALDHRRSPGDWHRPAPLALALGVIGRAGRRLDARVGSGAGLGARLVLARAVSGAGLLVNAALLGPAAFAGAGAPLALVGLAAVVAFLRYDGAVMGARCAREADAALALCAAAAVGVTALALLLALVAVASGAAPAPIALAAVLAVAARSALRWGVLSAARRGDVGRLGGATLVQAFAQPLVLLAMLAAREPLGIAASPANGALALVLADLAGHAVAALVALRGEPLPRPRRGDLRAVALEWRALPLAALPSTLLSCAFAALPGLALPSLLPPAAAGALLLVHRLLEVPTQLVGATAAPLLVRRLRAGPPPGGVACALLAAGVAAPLAGLGALGAVLALCGSGVAADAGAGLLLLAPLHAALAVGVPLLDAGAMTRRQGGALVVHALALASGAAVLLAAAPDAALVLLGLVGALRALALALLARAAATRAHRDRATSAGVAAATAERAPPPVRRPAPVRTGPSRPAQHGRRPPLLAPARAAARP